MLKTLCGTYIIKKFRQGVFLKKSYWELGLACLLLLCFYFLSMAAANASSVLVKEKKIPEKPAQKKTYTIVIDPGHGGEDPGMIGIGGLEEKKINLEISQLLAELLQKDGYTVFLTRTEDNGLYDAVSTKKKAQDMQRRVAFIAKKEPVLTVSIHQNSYQDEEVCGPQVFYYKDSVKGEKLAEEIQSSLNVMPGILRKREIKGNTSYYLLKRSPAVTVIVECGFLTNPEEADLLQKKEYQQKISEAIRRGIEKYVTESGKKLDYE